MQLLGILDALKVKNAICRSKIFKQSSGIFLLCLLFISLGGCASISHWFKEQSNPPTAKVLYQQAMTDIRHGRYVLAQDLFKQIQDQFPFSPYATLASLYYADCKFYDGDYEEAIPLYEEFIKLHPANKFVQYALFQEGSCYFNLMCTPDRDQTNTHKTIEVYERLLNQFPDTPYKREVIKRIAIARERLAEHELVVAHWYYRTNQLPQAIYRCKYLMEHYPHTPAVKKAKALLQKIAQRQAFLKKHKWYWWYNLFN